ncbi:MAG: alpha/beta fold hydrolase [Myxococcales bacterium]
MGRTSVRCVSVDGVNLNFLEAGSGDPVVLLHGIPTYAYLWREVLPGVADRHRAFAPDLLGCGRSDKAEYRDFSIPAQAELVSKFIAQLDVGPVALVGHDLGAAIAQVVAMKYPGTVNRLALINPPDGQTYARMQLERYRPAELARKTTVEEILQFLRTSLPSQVGGRTKLSLEVLENYLIPWETPAGMGALFQLARAIDHHTIEQLLEQMQQVSLPTLVVAGAEDELSPVESCRRVAESIPGATLETLEATGHLAPEESPHELARMLDRFLTHAREERPTTVH